jgi:hypothetical protein
MVSARRTIISLCMAMLYLLIVLTPLAPMVMHSPRLAHAITGECSGDCAICDCSPERSAARTCCCWQNRGAANSWQLTALRHDTAAEPDRQPRKLPPCCQKMNPLPGANPAESTTDHQCDHDRTPSASGKSAQQPNEAAVTAIGTCPCDGSRQLFTGEYESGHHLPVRHTAGIPIVSATTATAMPPGILVSRSVAPPVPPPKITPSC